MSTYWYFECIDHVPALQSSEEFTQHTEDMHFVHGVELARNRPVEPVGPASFDRSREYFDQRARDFLVQHPTCRLGLINEYGDRLELEAVSGVREVARGSVNGSI